jgi:site-specific DNA-cytosine methylase
MGMTRGEPQLVRDLLAGAGGLSVGFKWAWFKPSLAIDHDAAAVETLDADFGDDDHRALVRDPGTVAPKPSLRLLNRVQEKQQVVESNAENIVRLTKNAHKQAFDADCETYKRVRPTVGSPQGTK